MQTWSQWRLYTLIPVFLLVKSRIKQITNRVSYVIEWHRTCANSTVMWWMNWSFKIAFKCMPTSLDYLHKWSHVVYQAELVKNIPSCTIISTSSDKGTSKWNIWNVDLYSECKNLDQLDSLPTILLSYLPSATSQLYLNMIYYLFTQN